MIAQKLHILHNKKNDNNERNPAQNNAYPQCGLSVVLNVRKILLHLKYIETAEL